MKLLLLGAALASAPGYACDTHPEIARAAVSCSVNQATALERSGETADLVAIAAVSSCAAKFIQYRESQKDCPNSSLEGAMKLTDHLRETAKRAAITTVIRIRAASPP